MMMTDDSDDDQDNNDDVFDVNSTRQNLPAPTPPSARARFSTHRIDLTDNTGQTNITEKQTDV